MLKKVFFGKSWKNRRSVGFSSPKTLRSPAARGSAPRPQAATPTQLTALLKFFRIVKITTYNIILERRLVGPLANHGPLAQTSSYAIEYLLF